MGNREALLEGAKRCLLEKGYAKTTARDIADAAGVSLAAIGYHYGSKESLLEQAFMAAMEEWFADEEPGAREGVEQSEQMGRSERSEPLEASKQRRRGEEAPSGEAGERENRGRADAVGQAGRAGQAHLAGKESRADEAESADQAEGGEQAKLAERAESAGRAEAVDQAGRAGQAQLTGEASRAGHAESADRAGHVDSTGRAERVERAESADLDEQVDQAEAAGRPAFATGRARGSLEEFRDFFESVIATFPHQRALLRLNLEMGLEGMEHANLGAFMSSAMQQGREGLAEGIGGLDPERDGELAQQVGSFYSVLMTGVITQYLMDRERFPSASDLTEGLRYIAERALKA